MSRAKTLFQHPYFQSYSPFVHFPCLGYNFSTVKDILFRLGMHVCEVFHTKTVFHAHLLRIQRQQSGDSTRLFLLHFQKSCVKINIFICRVLGDCEMCRVVLGIMGLQTRGKLYE